MKVYLDIIFLVNFIFDFILLLSSSIILKRNIKIYRIIFGALFGSLSLLILFIRLSNTLLLIYKVVISIFMVLITFGYKDVRYFIKNVYYLYLISIILGGIIYFFNNQFSSSAGLVFINSYKYNMVLGIVLSIIGIKIYIKSISNLKTNYNKYLKATIYLNNEKINVNAFLDTGNKLKDPYSLKPIILVDKNMIKENNNVLYVPYKTCNSNGLLKCIKAKKIYIDGIGYKKNFLVGLSDPIKIDGINCILNERLLEG